MKVQRISDGNFRYSYLLLDDNYQIVEMVQRYFSTLVGKASPNSLKKYCYDLKLFHIFMKKENLKYSDIGEQGNSALEILSRFKAFLRSGEDRNLPRKKSIRAWTTVNSIVTTTIGFFDFLALIGEIPKPAIYLSQRQIPRYRRFLSEIDNKEIVIIRNLLLVKTPLPSIDWLSEQQFYLLYNACNSIRDKLILAIMFEGGLRLGEVLGLHRQDIDVWKNKIKIVARENLENEARVKWQSEGEIYVPSYVIRLYLQYLIDERGDYQSEFVFINLFKGNKGKPMKHSTVEKKFLHLFKKTDLRTHPHSCRHGFATLCYQNGMNWAEIQHLLRHRHLATTMNLYIHLENGAFQEKIKAFISRREIYAPPV